MTSYLSKSFFFSSKGKLAIYLCLFQMPKLPKKLVKVENKGGTQLSIFCKPLRSYLVVRISNSWSNQNWQTLRSYFVVWISDSWSNQNWQHIQLSLCKIWPWTMKSAWEITVAVRFFLLASTKYQTTSNQYYSSSVSLSQLLA